MPVQMPQPPPFQTAVYDKSGKMVGEWQRFFLNLQSAVAALTQIINAGGGLSPLVGGFLAMEALDQPSVDEAFALIGPPGPVGSTGAVGLSGLDGQDGEDGFSLIGPTMTFMNGDGPYLGSLTLAGTLTITNNPNAGFIQAGVNPAQSGVIRMTANSVGIQFRNNANTADCGCFTSDGADNAVIGFSNTQDVIFKPNNTEQARIKVGSGIQLVTTAGIFWNGRIILTSPADAEITFTNNATTIGFGLQTAAADTMTVANKAQNAFGSIQSLDHRVEATGKFFFNGRAVMTSPADAEMNFLNNAQTSGFGVQMGTDGTMIVANRAQNAYGFVDAKYKAEGTAGVATFGPSAVASITVKDGIITAIS